jgi:hypothetical protein
MSFLLRTAAAALGMLASMPKPIPVGTVTGRLGGDDPELQEMPVQTSTTDVPLDQQELYIPLELNYEQIERRLDAAYAKQDPAAKIMQLPRDPGLSTARKIKVSSKLAAAWNKVKPTNLTADDMARIDAAQRKRDRKAVKRAVDRARTVQGTRLGWLVLRGDRNAYEVH